MKKEKIKNKIKQFRIITRYWLSIKDLGFLYSPDPHPDVNPRKKTDTRYRTSAKARP